MLYRNEGMQLWDVGDYDLIENLKLSLLMNFSSLWWYVKAKGCSHI